LSDATLTESDADIRWKLPRGPHALPQDLVAANQRQRLITAAAAAIAERGYAELAVKDLIDRAGVSRRTFYHLFEDKLDCVFAAHNAAFSRLNAEIVDACAAEAAWGDGVVAAVKVALEFAADSPDEARLILISSHTSSEPALARRGRAAHEQLAALLRSGRQRGRHGQAPPPAAIEEAIIGAAMSLVGNCLLDEPERLPDLAPELVQIILTPYLGDGEARRAAEAVAA
jgi:AcrR family transcriptional regulator